MNTRFVALPSETVEYFRRGGPDAYGNPPERKTSDGAGAPCRHCLALVGRGEPYLVLAHRPFTTLQPYAETGPIFLHAEECPRYEGEALPPMLESPDYIVRGYDCGERIVYGTGGVIARNAIRARAAELLQRADIAFVHIRSARNNCYQCRVERA